MMKLGRIISRTGTGEEWPSRWNSLGPRGNVRMRDTAGIPDGQAPGRHLARKVASPGAARLTKEEGCLGDASPGAATVRRPFPRAALAVAGVALAVRLALFSLGQGDPDRIFYRPDSSEYDALAESLASRGTYSQTTDPAAAPELARTPGYPLVVAAVYLLLGHRPMWAALLNVLLGVGVSLLTYLLGLRVFGRRAALAAGLILALDLASAVYANLLLSETAFTLLLLLVLAGLPPVTPHPRMGRMVLSGLLLGGAVLARPIGVYLPFVLAPVFLLGGDRANLRRRVRGSLAFAGCALLLVLPWVVRNYVVAGVAELTSLGAVNLLYHRAAPVKAAVEGMDLQASRKALEAMVEKSGVTAKPVERLRTMKDLGKRIIAAHWGTYVRLHLVGMGRLLGPEHDSVYELLGYRPPSGSEGPGLPAGGRPLPPRTLQRLVDLWQWALLGPIYLVALIGFVSAVRGDHGPAAILFLVVVGYFLAMSGPEAYARFRVPMMPAIALLAGHGVSSLCRQVRP